MIFEHNVEWKDSMNSYHSNHQYLSKTDLSNLLSRPARFRRQRLHLESRKVTKAFRIGHHVHALILTPELAKEEEYRRLECKKIKEKVDGFELMALSDADIGHCHSMSEAVREHSFAKRIFELKGKSEVSYYWFDEDLNLGLKCRPDFRTDDYKTVVDVKTTRDVSYSRFQRSAFDLDYDVSVALTLRGVEAVTGVRPDRYVFLVVESGAFPDVVAYEASTCGRAFSIGANEDEAFAIAKVSCATGYFSFGHELGHLIGARHIITQDAETTPFSYGHGYCNSTSDTWRTIMAYNCPINTGGSRINYWSSPLIDILGDPTGSILDEDNARVISNRFQEVANFEEAYKVAY